MSFTKVASIDIGTNTILMMIADYDCSDNQISIVEDYHSIARLGENLNKTGIISQEALKRATAILEDYKSKCGSNRVEEIFAVGTSALRDAKNAGEVCKTLSQIINSDIEVISGNQEAYCSFNGTVENDLPSIVIDIGGGSTEIIAGKNGEIDYRKSINIGAVRLTEMFFEKHPPHSHEMNSAIKFIDEQIQSFDKLIDYPIIYAVAGTPTSLASSLLGLKEYDPERVNGFILKVKDVDNLIKLFSEMDLVEIVDTYFIHPKRADVITMGSMILSRIMKYMGRNECRVSSNGLRLGVIKWKTNNCK